MGHRFSTRVLAALATLSLAGCGSVTPIPATVATPGMPNAERALQASMTDVGREMARIGNMGPAAAASARPIIVTGELDREISFQWNGSLDDAIRQLAQIIGYAVEIRGASPFTQRVHVSIDPAPRRVYDLFRMLGEQAGSQAVVKLDSQHHVVEVIYLG